MDPGFTTIAMTFTLFWPQAIYRLFPNSMVCVLFSFVFSSLSMKNEQQNKGKKKKKGGLPGGGLKAKMKDDLDDYGEFDGGYVQDYEDFM